MKRKTIKKILSSKFAKFTNSIKDASVRELVEKHSIISGGAITSMLLNEDVNDYDIYFTNKETVLAVANYYTKNFTFGNNKPKVIENDGVVSIFAKNTGCLLRETKEVFEPTFVTSNAVTLLGDVQLILRFYGEANKIHENFDFIHATCYWVSLNNSLILPPRALEAIINRELFYSGSKYPLCSVFRSQKFIKRGWSINAGQYLKMCLQVSELDLLNPKVLEDQLVGVDFAYFQIIIDDIKGRAKDDPDFRLEPTILISLIDEIF